ncbi:hypothetical protein [Methanolacinia petrolearia]|uniref:hypothetical protein n=1 Tax=Methanolacinia petrolearia TaxID=54120 RepID=UPI003BAAA392
MKIVKEKITSGKVTAGGVKISSAADISAFVYPGGFVFSVCPISIIVETESGTYSFDLKREELPLQIR